MIIDDLKVEYRKNPIGIDGAAPRFSWKIQSDYNNMIQTSYQILAYADEATNSLVWDSGIVESSQSQQVRWAGAELKSMERVFWKVKAEIQNESIKENSESELAFFEMGLLKEKDWHCDWIEPLEQSDYMNFQPAPILRREFSVKPGLRSAKIYQTAHGLYEFWINGKQGTDEKFKPGFTCYQSRTQYQVYDITEYLLEGQNIWSVALGDGWWRGTLGGSSRNNWGYKLQFLGQIVLTYEDSAVEYVCSDTQFKYSYGGIRVCDLRAGEVFDTEKEPLGWKEIGFDDSTWKQVVKTEDMYCVKDNLIASKSVPVLEKEEFEAKPFYDAAGELVLDFGQNIAGYVRMKLRGCKKGQKIVLQHGEDIKDGKFSMENLMAEMFVEERFQIIEYICSGDEEEIYCPTFAVFGFRYVKVTGYDGEIMPGDFVAVAVYSALEETGDFVCSNPLINQLVKNSRWSQKGNYLDVPTDCPTRERSPWTGDSQVYCRTAADFMNVYPFFEKWMQDFNFDQLKNGKFKNTIPSGSRNLEENKRAKAAFFESIAGKEDLSMTDYMILKMYSDETEDSGVADGSSGWSDAAVINPYTMYLCYGDRQIIENQYESAAKHVEYMFERAKNANPNREQAPEYHTWTYGELDADYIWDTEFHWGEWLEADVGTAGEMERMMEKFTNADPEVPTAFLCYSTRLVGEMAHILGRDDEAKLYFEKSERVKRMFN
ncbi:family 78 glycoside hydrolase catalytic domain, partial [Paenibacillus albidus]|uniref:family 78 glycoside hydrolase catalytic domain n=1 Tax=Paenibacillus albidus TaxID=2041023 RepID=UPI001BE673CB